MVKPPDSPISGSKHYYSYYKKRRSQDYQDCQREYHSHFNNKNYEKLHQHQLEKIYQNRKRYPYRTWKWLQFCRIAYPGPYSGPGPGPGTNIGIMHQTTASSISAENCDTLSAQIINKPVVIIAPPDLSISSRWPKARRRIPMMPTARKASVFAFRQQQNQKKYQQHRQRWMFGRNFLWLLIVLICFDSGPLVVDCNLTTALATHTTPTVDRRGSNSRSNSSTAFKLNMVNNYTKFLNNNNAYNNRINIIDSSGKIANNNSKHSINDYKSLLIYYNDIYTNTKHKYNPNQYNNSKINSNRRFSNSRSIFSYNMSSNNNYQNKNSLFNSELNANTNKNYSKYKEDNNVVDIKSKPLVSEQFTPTDFEISSTTITVPVSSTPLIQRVITTSVSSLISQKKNSMKASLNAISNFKAGKMTSTPTMKVSSTTRAKKYKHYKDDGKMAEMELNENLIKQHQQQPTKQPNKVHIECDDDINHQQKQNQHLHHHHHHLEQEQEQESHPYFQQHNPETNANNKGYHSLRNQKQHHSIHQSSNNNEYQIQNQLMTIQGQQGDIQRQRDTLQHQYHNDRHYHHQNHHYHSNSNSEQGSSSVSTSQTKLYESIPVSESSYHDKSLQLDDNYKRSILASISCPNCLYNINPYLSSELFDSSLISSTSALLSSSSSPSSSFPQSSSSSSTMPSFKRYQTVQQPNNQPKQLHQHHTYHYQQQQQQQHQQQQQQNKKLLHQRHNDDQYSSYVPNNNNNHYINQKSSFHTNNKKLNNNQNTIDHNNNNNNNFHQTFHQFDSDQIRLESIKHQILSKLGLKSKPNVTQTLPKQFIMETIYRAESSGIDNSPIPIQLKSQQQYKNSESISDSKRKNSFSDSYKIDDVESDGVYIVSDDNSKYDYDNIANNFFYNDYINSDNIHSKNQLNPVKNNNNNKNLVSSSTLSSSKFLLNRRTSNYDNGENNGENNGEMHSIDSDYEINRNSKTNHQEKDTIKSVETLQSSLSSTMSSSPVNPSLSLVSSSSSSSTLSSAEQDDFYGRTKEIITFAEKGDVLNGHRLVEFSSLSDQMTGQNLRIRAASMWIRVDLRPSTEKKRSPSRGGPMSSSSSSSQSSSVNGSKLKIWVFRLIEPFATSLNSTEFIKKDFDKITKLSTTLNVQFNQLGWQKLDITETVQSWYANDQHVRLRLFIDCSGCGDRITLHLFDNTRSSKIAYNGPNSKNPNHNHSQARKNHHHHHHHDHHHRPNQRQNSSSSGRKHGHHFSQKSSRYLPKGRKDSHLSINRTSAVSLVNETDIAALMAHGNHRNRQYFYRSDNKSRISPALRHRNNGVRKLPKPSLFGTNSFRQESSKDGQSHYEVNPNRPFLVIHTEPNVMKRVRRRALDCSGAFNGQCCKESFYVSFKALGWDDWIIAPHGYFANYCRGDCAGPRTPDTYQSYHTHVIEEFRKLDRLTGMQPCCAPLKFSSMSLIYYGKEGIIKRDLPKMVVDECGCP
ncbi:uncharacterized protein DDB_G0283357 isoform X2 [Hermetia illucens]|uniref:uncharacterized protein DDB_G0283357 isoform X2 n=1 Tax=Hermetia illucens TaxID=343691 RepID=UPI0018CC5E42|nr:uncharacterized protein DDB_G0283357 isoform X2 [Hermetia illucens]